MQSFNGFIRPVADGAKVSNIKSIQRGSATINATNSVDVAITSINLTQSILNFGCSKASGNVAPVTVAVMGKLTNSTNINFSTDSNAVAITVYWEVIEFNNVKSVQRGDLTINADNTDIAVTINSVNISKSMAITSCKTGYSTATAIGVVCAAQLTSATNLNVRGAYPSGYAVTAHWQVIEFY